MSAVDLLRPKDPRATIPQKIGFFPPPFPSNREKSRKKYASLNRKKAITPSRVYPFPLLPRL
jgi:hypothetical protein